MIYFCCDDNRRALAGAHPTLNGIDYLEVVDREAATLDERQRRLRLYFCRQPSSTLLTHLEELTTANVQITGGERISGIRPDKVTLFYKDAAKTRFEYLEIHVTPRGDYSPYTLRLVENSAGMALAGLDPELSSIDFWFKVECENPFDCLPRTACHVPVADVPEIDYLSKDYASFRQLILDRMAVLLPDWRERNPADLGMTLVELLAYVGDRLSYRQDAVATEAYLGTARHRVSVRRHARLLDYPMHDGCNARVWVQVRLKPFAPGPITLPRLLVPESGGSTWVAAENEPVPTIPANWRVRRTRFLTRAGKDAVVSEEEFRTLADAGGIEVFEPLHGATLVAAHNEMRFHTYCSDECCLPRGAVKATLFGAFPHLKPGDVLIFAEVVGPKSGNRADADTSRRHAVRLTRVTAGVDALFRTGDDEEQPVTEIEWGSGDALPFPFCLASVTESGRHVGDVSVAWGNIVLADHGMSLIEPETLDALTAPNRVLTPVVSGEGCGCGGGERTSAPARFSPRLRFGQLTQVATITRTRQVAGQRMRLGFDPSDSAASAFQWDTEHLLPAIRLGCERGLAWLPRRDLLSTDSFGREFVAEVDDEGRAVLRFGDDENGMRPGEGMEMYALYRLGNGAGGNVGANAIAHVVADTMGSEAEYVESVSNPLPARGGVEPESLETVKQFAPAAFRIPKRAVTPDDYARMAELHPEVQRAAATLRWTGSWHTIYLTVDRTGGRRVDSQFENELRRHLESYRMAGHDLEIDAPRPVPLELMMTVCVLPDYFRSDVLAALQEMFDNGIRSDGTRGFFHPDNFTFGQPVHLSRIYAAAQSVAGVRYAEVTALRRLGESHDTVPSDGVFAVGRLEIVRLDSDPNFPDRGRLTFTMKGGR